MNREMTEGERELDLLAGDLIAENKQLRERVARLESEKRDLYRDLANRLDAIGHKSEIAMLISDWIRRQS